MQSMRHTSVPVVSRVWSQQCIVSHDTVPCDTKCIMCVYTYMPPVACKRSSTASWKVPSSASSIT